MTSDDLLWGNYWKLYVYASVEYDDGNLKEVIRVEKEESTWRIKNCKFVLEKDVYCVPYSICTQELLDDGSYKKDEGGHNYVFARNGKIHFTEGRFLRLDDLYLEADNPDSLLSKIKVWKFNAQQNTAVFQAINEELKGKKTIKCTFGENENGNDYIRQQISIEDSNKIENLIIQSSRNIRLEVDFQSNAASAENPSIISPLFYMEQNKECDVIFLGEKQCLEKKQREIYWEISKTKIGEHYQTRPFNIDDNSYGYTITVNQDLDRTQKAEEVKAQQGYRKTSYFEIFADAISLPLVNDGYLDVDRHKFSEGEQKVYIGFSPYVPESSGATPAVFNGTISRLVFDPNSSCVSCAG